MDDMMLSWLFLDHLSFLVSTVETAVRGKNVFFGSQIERWEYLVLIISKRHEIRNELRRRRRINAEDHAGVMNTEKNVAAVPVGKGTYRIKEGLRQIRFCLFLLELIILSMADQRQ